MIKFKVLKAKGILQQKDHEQKVKNFFFPFKTEFLKILSDLAFLISRLRLFHLFM